LSAESAESGERADEELRLVDVDTGDIGEVASGPAHGRPRVEPDRVLIGAEHDELRGVLERDERERAGRADRRDEIARLQGPLEERVRRTGVAHERMFACVSSARGSAEELRSRVTEGKIPLRVRRLCPG
jgi:hypothetical protein